MKSSTKGFAEYYQLRSKRLSELQDGFIRITMDYRGDDSEGLLTVTVMDSGSGFDMSQQRDNNHKLEGYSGRGLPLLKTLCNSVEHKGSGNEIEVKFQWSYGNSRT